MNKNALIQLCALMCMAMGTAFAAAPKTALVTLNIEADDRKGAEARALVLVDVVSDQHWKFPFSTIEGGPVEGQPMHAAMSVDKKQVYVTMGGNKSLPLRIVTVSVDWSGAAPKTAVVRTTEVLKANTVPSAPGLSLCGVGKDPAIQEGHGPTLSQDGRFLFFSELNNHRLRVLNTRTGHWVGNPITHPSLKTPHGVYPNPSNTRAMSTQYQLDGNQVSIWKLNATTGDLAFDRAITLKHGNSGCAYTHTASWLNDNQFFTGCTQELAQGTTNLAERSVWLVDAAKGSARPVLNAADIKEGVSDTALVKNKLYVAEGNLEKEGVPPGHVSVWDVRHPHKPVLIKRLSPGKGLPAKFGDAHEVAHTPDGRYVFAQSFRSGYLVKIDTRTDTVVKVWGAADGITIPHGLAAR